MFDYAQLVMYFNIGFLAILGFALLGGLFRGFKKSLISLISMVLYYAVFFLTINIVVNLIYDTPIPFVGQLLQMVFPNDPALHTLTTIEEIVSALIVQFGGEQIVLEGMSAAVLELVASISLFALKIVYTVLYFTVGWLLWKIIFGILASIIFGGNKKGASKNPLLGGIIGLAKGAVSIFVMLIMLGGLISFSQSLLVLATPLLAEEGASDLFEEPNRFDIYQANQTLIPLSEAGDPASLEDTIQMLEDLVRAFNENIVVTLYQQITITDETTQVELPMYLYLFDSVMSIPYRENEIALRQEIAVFANIANTLFESEFQTTQDLADIKAEEIQSIFTSLSQSKLVVVAMPALLEFAVSYFETDIEIDAEALAEINWKNEIENLGTILSTLFEILNTAGFISGEGELETIEVDGDTVRDLFDSLGASELMVLLVEVFLVPLVEEDGSELGKILTIPADLNWTEEFEAIGEVLGAVLDAEIPFADLQSESFSVILNAVAQIDLTVLLNSRLITGALVNVLSGEAGLEGLDVLTIPGDIQWYDTLDNDGNVVVPGELRNILLALNAIADAAGSIDLENLGLNTISALTNEVIDTLFNSRILVATISDVILSQDLGGEMLIVPDSVFDNQGYLEKEELKAVARAIKLLVGSGDEVNFDVSLILNLDSDDIDTLLASEILAATVGNVLYDMGGDLLIVPSTATSSVLVDAVGVSVVSSAEIKNLLLSVQVLGFSDLDSFEFGVGILNALEEVPAVGDPTQLDSAKVQTLFNSLILHATVSNMILDLTQGTQDFLVVPAYNALNQSIQSQSGGATLISTTELEALLQALYALDITDFNNLESFSIASILASSNVLLNSAIIQATFSKQILDLGAPVYVPSVDSANQAVIITVDDSTEYIVRSELENFIDAIDVFNITDLSSFSGGIDLTILQNESNRNTILASAILHYTISKQIFDVESTVLSIPAQDVDSNAIKVQVGALEYLAKTEIHALLVALDQLGFTDLNSFSGEIDSTMFFTNTNTLLASAIIHATISKQLLDVESSALTIPTLDVSGNPVQVVVGLQTYITKAEINALLAALDELGFGDLNSVSGQIDSSKFFTNTTLLLDSATIHATISKQLLEEPGGVLRVLDSSRVTQGAVVYITKAEINSLFAALDELGFTNFNTFNFDQPATLLSADTTVLFASSTMQATVSKVLLDAADDETAPVGQSTLIVPLALRESILVSTVSVSQIEINELKALFVSMNLLGITDFNASFNASAITTMSEANLTTLFDSGSMHMTVNNMLKGNANIAADIPALAQDTFYNVANVIKDTELVDFILATQVFGGDFTNVNFNFTTISTMSVGDRQTALGSMIVRNKITPDVETAVLLKDPFYTIPNTYYELNDSNQFLTAQGVQDLIDFINA